MAIIKSFYLSRVLDNRVQTHDGKNLGLLKELIFSNAERARVLAAVVKTDKGLRTLDWNHFAISKDNHQYRITCEKPVDMIPPQNAIHAKKHILDKQIVDIDGKKVVRVNDVRMALISNGIYVVAVDVGVEGLLRRLGVARPMKKMLQVFGKNLPSKFILWSNIGALVPPLENLRLTTTYAKLDTLHPSDLADIIEDLDVKTGTAIFSALDHERAADVMEELEDEAQSNILDHLTVEKAADVLEKMPADEVADILDDLEEGRAEELLQEMDQETSADVRDLMEYPEDSAGSLMTKEFLAFKGHMTTGQVIDELRRLKPESDAIYYLYVVDEEDKLVAHVSLRDLVVASPGTHLEQIGNRRVLYVYDHDDISLVAEMFEKYSLLAIPVVDQDMKMLGIVIIDDLYELVKSRKRL